MVCASSEALINALIGEGICLVDIEYIDAITICAKTPPGALPDLAKLTERYCGKYKLVERHTTQEKLLQVLKYRVTLFMIAILTVLTIFLPTRILFIRVLGAQAHDVNNILDAAETCGLRWGAPARELRSEEIKNVLLTACPELTWAGVNIKGCVAEISVTLRESQPVNNTTTSDNICAAYDGCIRQIVVLKGRAVCSVGDMVTKGQQLVSGYDERGHALRYTGAEAEIYAQTIRQLSVISPAKCAIKGRMNASTTKYSLIIGKKLINLYNSCGISMVTCDRISKRYPLVLPGGFELPVSILQEHSVDYEIVDYHFRDPAEFSWMTEANEVFLESVGMLGYIEKTIHDELAVADVATYYGEYFCVEMIAQKSEAFIRNNE